MYVDSLCSLTSLDRVTKTFLLVTCSWLLFSMISKFNYSSQSLVPAYSYIKKDRIVLAINDSQRGSGENLHTKQLPCPKQPPGLMGAFKPVIKEDLVREKLHTLEQLKGGVYHPPNCTAQQTVLIIIPYRDREQHLLTLLANLHPLLQKQQRSYRIVVAEQEGNETFNKGVIMNAAFLEAKKLGQFECVIFHDVDLIPENDKNIYKCVEQPYHMSYVINRTGTYKAGYRALVGGVLALKKQHVELVNGYSNEFWGWGGEDDDMELRIKRSKLRVQLPSKEVGRYHMLKHIKRPPSGLKRGLFKTSMARLKTDGLNSLNYTVVSLSKVPLYTHLLVRIEAKSPIKCDEKCSLVT